MSPPDWNMGKIVFGSQAGGKPVKVDIANTRCDVEAR
jgi:hypothetical protein